MNRPQNGKLAFILYQDRSFPRYYEISKNMFKFIIYGPASFSFLCLLAIVLMAVYFKDLRRYSQKQEESAVLQQSLEKKTLLKEKEELLKANTQLQNKLAQALGQKSDFPLDLFKSSTSKGILSIEKSRAFIRGGAIHFSFDLFNKSQGQKRLTGFVHVLLKKGNQIFFWPSKSMPEDKLALPFNKGEPFSTMRFRPVKTIFPIDMPDLASTTDLVFLIVVHDTAGNMIHRETIAKSPPPLKEEGQ